MNRDRLSARTSEDEDHRSQNSDIDLDNVALTEQHSFYSSTQRQRFLVLTAGVSLFFVIFHSGYLSYQAIDPDKLLWALGPGRQLHVRNHGSIFHHSQVVTVGVDKHLRKVVELWDQLLHGQSTDIHIVEILVCEFTGT